MNECKYSLDDVIKYMEICFSSNPLIGSCYDCPFEGAESCFDLLGNYALFYLKELSSKSNEQ